MDTTPPEPTSYASLDSGLLKTFVAVAAAGQLSAAAQRLRLSQPAVTAQVRRLEEVVRASLFVRSSRGVVLTPAGRRLHEYARQIDWLLRRAVEELGPAREVGGEVVLAATPTPAHHVLPSLLTEFVARHPRTTVRLRVGRTAEVVGWVASRQVPAGLVEGEPPTEPGTDPGARAGAGTAAAVALALAWEPFVGDELVAVVGAPSRQRPQPARWRAVGRATDLVRVPVLWQETDRGAQRLVEAALRRAGVAPEELGPAWVLGSADAVRAAVVAGAGVGFLSRWGLGADLAAGRLHVLPLADVRITRTFSWVRPRTAAADPAASIPSLPGDAGSSPAEEFVRFARRTLSGPSSVFSGFPADHPAADAAAPSDAHGPGHGPHLTGWFW